jgi:hypothetical protein
VEPKNGAQEIEGEKARIVVRTDNDRAALPLGTRKATVAPEPSGCKKIFSLVAIAAGWVWVAVAICAGRI